MNVLVPFLLSALAVPQDGTTPDPTVPPPSGSTPTDGEAAPAQPEIPTEVMLLRMRDGTIHWGTMEDHDPDGLVFQLLAHGGVVEVPWSLVDPKQSDEMRLALGYVDVASEELLIEVERLLLVDGGEVTGVIESREGDNFTVRANGQQQLLPKTRVASISSGIQVPALDVYSREQLYGRELAKTAVDDPQGQLELARFCERILDFGHAVEHYEVALGLGLVVDAEKVELALGRAREKAKRQDQVDALRDADLLRKRGHYDEALANLDQFRVQWPDSPLLEDAIKKADQVNRARERAMRTFVAKRWNYWMKRLARDASKMEFQQAIGFATEEMPMAIREHVLEDVKKSITEHVEDAEIEALWASRKKSRFQNASYGRGTWLLGEDRALAGMDAKQEPKDRGPGERGAEREALEKKIEQFLRNQRRARSSRSSADNEEDMAAGWASFPAGSRTLWVVAYYAEFSGDMEVRDRPYLRNCPTCAGRGVLESISIGGGGEGTNSGISISRCSTCHGVGKVRRIYYR